MTTDTLDYSAFIDAGMRGVVRDILRQVEKSGLPGQHHFFIALRTEYPGVVMSEGLRAKYPKEITIVIQHQFWDLKVEQDYFKIALSFNNIPEKLVVPFAALTGFADPSTKFGLQFHSDERDVVPEAKPAKVVAPSITAADDDAEDAPREGAKVIALDAFRKK